MKIMCESCKGTGFLIKEQYESVNCSLIYPGYTGVNCNVCEGIGFVEHSGSEEVIWDGPYNESKDDAEMYCPVCDEHIPNDDWNYCHKCGVKLLIHGKDIY